MKSTLPAPKVRVTSSGSRPNSFDGVLVDAEHVAAGLGPEHRRVPLEAGQPFPDLGVVVLRVGQLGQQAAAAQFGQLEMVGRARAPAAGLRVVEHDRAEVAQLGVEQRELRAPAAGHEDQAAGLVLDQPLEQPALLGGQLAVVQADVAQEDHVVLRQLVEPAGNCLM